MNNIESLKGATRNNITLHIGNIFKEGELDDSIVRKESLLTAAVALDLSLTRDSAESHFLCSYDKQ